MKKNQLKSNNSFILEEINNIKLFKTNCLTYITKLKLTTTNNEFYGGRIRQLFKDSNFPIIGNTNNTFPLQSSNGQGVYLSLISLKFKDYISKQTININYKEPEKFEV